MRRHQVIPATLALATALISLAGAQTEVRVSGEIRHRFEADNRDLGASDASTLGLLRSRLNVSMTPAPGIETLVQIQDSRAMGEETSTLTDASADNLDFHQAWIRVDRLFGLPVDGKVGRMEAPYGPERLMGAVGWSNTGRSFDGAVAHAGDEKTSIDAFFFTEREAMAPGDKGDRRIIGVWGGTTPWEGQSVQPFFIWQRAVPATEMNRRTFGFYASGNVSDLSHEVEFAFQDGTLTASRRLDVQAWMAAASVTYAPAGSDLKPALSVGADYLSGDDSDADGTYKVFDTLYATNHKYYGFMDYFTSIPAHTFGRGLLDVQGGIRLAPTGKTKARLDAHYFRSAKEVSLTGPSSSQDFGQELDLTLVYRYAPPLSLTLGASAFFPGEVLKVKRGDQVGSWLYLMTTVVL